MEDKILTQEDDIEEDIGELEDEIEEEEVKEPKGKAKIKEPVGQVSETYEGFQQPARMGIVNTITGEVIEGFEIGKDEGIVQLGQQILNKLDKIAIASGV